MDYAGKIEQITYDGDGDTDLNPIIEEQTKSADNANSFDENERKSYEEPVEEEQANDATDALDDDAEESKEVESPAVPEVADCAAVKSEEAIEEVDSAFAEAEAVMSSEAEPKKE